MLESTGNGLGLEGFFSSKNCSKSMKGAVNLEVILRVVVPPCCHVRGQGHVVKDMDRVYAAWEGMVVPEMASLSPFSKHLSSLSEASSIPRKIPRKTNVHFWTVLFSLRRTKASTLKFTLKHRPVPTLCLGTSYWNTNVG